VFSSMWLSLSGGGESPSPRCWFLWEEKDPPPVSGTTLAHMLRRNKCQCYIAAMDPH
jgi:hypothetical protein